MIMQYNALIDKLGYADLLLDVSELRNSYPAFADIEALGVDKVYFSGNKPAVFFLNVDSFDRDTLLRIEKIQNNAWNYRRVIFLFVQSTTGIRVYNCYKKPVFTRKDDSEDHLSKQIESLELGRCTETETRESFERFASLFSRIGIDCGTIWTNHELKKKINLQERLDNFLVSSLSQTTNKLKETGLHQEIIHGLLIRSLFILFLEDKGAAREAGLYESIKPECQSYFDILQDKDATYSLFEMLQKHFNGNITPLFPGEKDVVTAENLNVVRNCFMDGDVSDNPKLFNNWRLFNFGIIQVELLSEVYELFLGQQRLEKGQFYTPHGLVDLILEEKLPIDIPNHHVRILDPACGSGIFLVESYRRLISRWKREHNTTKISFSELNEILLNNIFGIEIDETAIKVTAFSLYIALIDELDPKNLWTKDDYKLPYLIWEKGKEGGKNLLRMDTIGDVNADMLPSMDLIVGNPPFGTKGVLDSVKNYCIKKGFAVESVIAFIHKSVEFCPHGEIALIFNTKLLTNTQGTYCKFRKWLLNENYVEKLYNLSILRKVPEDFGGRLFNGATSPVSIIYFKHQQPKIISPTIAYWAPKSYQKTSAIDGIVINDSDIKFLPRTECQKANTKIWKIAQWGNYSCFRLLKRLENQNETLENFFKRLCWSFGRGLNADSKHPDFVPEQIINIKAIDRYYTNPQKVCSNNTKAYRKNNDELFKAPFIIFKQGQHKNKIACTLFEESCYCTTSAHIMNGGSLEDKKFLVSYLNSDIVNFQLKLTASFWGIEREIFLLNEVLDLASPFVPGYEQVLPAIVESFDKIVEEQKSLMPNEEEIKKQEQLIFDAFSHLLRITDNEKILIEDTLKYSIDLLENHSNSLAFHRATEEENISYAETLCNTLNTFLGQSVNKVSAYVYNSTPYDPLNIVHLFFSESCNQVDICNLSKYRGLLSKIEKQLVKEKSTSIYIQKNLKFYDGNHIYIVKPNQKRYWTRSQAEDDAAGLIAEIITMR